MKKYMPGFVPVDFKKAGVVLLVIGLGCLIVKGIAYLTNWFSVPNYILYFGLGVMVIGVYIVFATKGEKL